MEFSLTSLPAKNLIDFQCYIANVCCHNIYERNNSLVVINGTKDALSNYVFVTDKTTKDDYSSIIAFLQELKCEATWPFELNKPQIFSHSSNIAMGSIAEQAVLNISQYRDTILINHDLILEEVDNQDKLSQLDKLSANIFFHEENVVKNYLRALAKSKDKKLKFYLVKLSNETIGMCGIYIQDNGIVGFYGDGILLKYRNLGLGSEIVRKRIRIAKEKGYHTIIAHCMPKSVNLYKNLGFNFIKKLYLYIYEPK